MTKQEAVEKMVEEFNAIPTDWVKTILNNDGEYPNLPMWGTMWTVDSILGKTLWKNSTEVVSPENCESHDKDDTCQDCEDWEEMEGIRNLKDKDGNSTPVYIYDVRGEYVIGIHAAGWDFYHGVWDVLYDILGLKWHEIEDSSLKP